MENTKKIKNNLGNRGNNNKITLMLKIINNPKVIKMLHYYFSIDVGQSVSTAFFLTNVRVFFETKVSYIKHF